MQTNHTPHWVSTSSRVSGCGYGYEIMRDDAALGIAHGVRLFYQGQFAIVAAEDYNDARRRGEWFADCCRAWQVVQNRERALANGIAVIS